MEEQKKEKNRKEKVIILLLLILIALIIIIFLFIKCLGRIDNKGGFPTGNVDIFDIIFGTGSSCNNCKCGCTAENKNPQCNCNSPECICNGMNLPMTEGGENEGRGNNSVKGVAVYDNDNKFSVDTELNIFKQKSYHVLKDKIAPGSENSYQFVIRNNNNFNIRYDLKMREENEYNINMRYRLKLNGKFVVGNDNEYVTVDELNRYNIGLVNNSYDVYTLDWKWIENSNDTEIGMNIEANYKLKIQITATQV